MFNDILIGVDEEARADHAVAAGSYLADTFASQLRLVHAVRMEQRPWWLDRKEGWQKAREQLLANARKSRQEHLKSLSHPRYGHLAYDDLLEVVEGDPARTLAEVATTADLIVLGEHKKKGLLDLSGTARGLLTISPCPVWVQKTAWDDHVRKVLVPVDMSVHSAQTADLAVRMAACLGARVLVFHAFEPPFHAYLPSGGSSDDMSEFVVDDYRKLEQDALERFVERLPAKGVELDALFVDGRPAEKILAAQDEADIVIMGTQGHGGMLRSILGSVAYKVVTRATKPVLAVPHSALEADKTGQDAAPRKKHVAG